MTAEKLSEALSGSSLKQLLNARKIFTQILLIVFFMELLVMGIFNIALLGLPWWVEAMVDASVLSSTIFISAWYLQLRPLRRAVLRERQLSAKLAKESQVTIEEQRVALIEQTKLSALGELAADMAHEINNPVAAIRITAEQLSEVIAEDPAVASEMAHTIATQAARVGLIVEGLRHLARGGASAPAQAVGIRWIIENALKLYGDFFPDRAHMISVTIDPVLENGMILNCRPIQIEQVLINLVNNACDAIRDSTQKWVRIAAKYEEGSLIVSVSDSGRISPEARKQLFRPFFTTKAPGKGSGLGLGICKRIVESHKGQLSFDDTAPTTCFVIRLPISPEG